MHPFTNLYGCRSATRPGSGRSSRSRAGSDRRALQDQSHTFVCEGVTIGDEVFVGHGVLFINDNLPRATSDEARSRRLGLGAAADAVERGASLGSGAVVLGGVRSASGRWSAPEPSSRATSAPARSSPGFQPAPWPPKGRDEEAQAPAQLCALKSSALSARKRVA